MKQRPGAGTDHALISRRTVLVSAVSLFPATRLFLGQASQQTPTFSANVKVVNVFATVRDKQGRIVRNLTKDDFTLEEDGRPQTIRYFAQQCDLPLTLGLLVDTSGSERRMLSTERDASHTFLEQVLRPEKDQAFLIHFDHEVELLQDLTASRERLEKALELIDKPEWSNGGNSPSGGRGNGGYGRRGGGWHRGAGGTTFYDAIYLASDDLMKKQRGRKALIMLTDGEDNASKVSLQDAIDSAQRADTLAYSVRIADQEQGFSGGFPGGSMGRHGGMGRGGAGRGPAMNRPDGKKILKQISKETGGGYFEVSKKKPVHEIYSQIEEELRNQYSIGYTSDKPDSEAGFRRIQLTARPKDLIVQARDGYYAAASQHQS